MWESRRVRIGLKRVLNDVDLMREAVEQKDDVKGCQHYQRRCKIVAPCCGELFWCRLCHDDHILLKDHHHHHPIESIHQIDRFAIEKCVCTDCGLEQPVAKTCVGCKVIFARYYCPICHLWDDDINKGIWHCNDCGLCRRGGPQKFFHCLNCNVCVPKDTQHKCLPNALRDKCSICLEDMFSSTRLVTYVSDCGHAMHKDCFESFIKSGRWNGCCTICKAPVIEISPETNTSSDDNNNNNNIIIPEDEENN